MPSTSECAAMSDPPLIDAESMDEDKDNFQFSTSDKYSTATEGYDSCSSYADHSNK